MKARALWIVGKSRAEIRDIALPEVNDDQVLVRSLFSGVSRGSELLVYNNLVPQSQFKRMRAPFQEGDFPYPVKYGYINVGIVESRCHDLHGKKVFCLYPHQSHYIVPADAVTVIPDIVSTQRAILTANIETAVNALWDAGISIGDRVSVVGAGVVGCLVAYLAGRIPGCHVELIDIKKTRQNIADQLGVEFAMPDSASTSRDLVVHASASEEGLNTALNLAGTEATVLELSWYGNRPVTAKLGESFHSRRLQLISSQVGQVAMKQRSRWTSQRRIKFAMSLLADPRLDCLISGESAFESLPETLTRLSDASHDALCHCVRYE